MKKLAILFVLVLCNQAVSSQETEEIVEEVVFQDVEEEEIEEEQDIPFAVIEEVPIFPGCENLDKKHQKSCFQNKIVKHISKKFNYKTKDSLSSGLKKIYVVFKIDKDGVVKNIKARGPHPELEIEAKRVVELLPNMTPGKLRGKNVSVSYILPITFKVE